jgi:Holliday junction DNA helicase RuvA
MCSPQTVASARVGQDITLATSLIVREDSLTLFGFESAESRELFDIIQSVSGFGAKLAFTIVSTLAPEELRAAIANEDVVRLTKTPGVGAKGAQRLILELKDKIGYAEVISESTSSTSIQVQQALVGLGYTAKDAARATQSLVEDSGDVAAMLKQALQILGNS